jgi:Matrixin
LSNKIAILLLSAVAARSATLRYWVEPCTADENVCHAGDPELAQWAMEAWQAASGGKLTLEKTASRESAHIRLFWTGGRAGLYGEARPIRVDGVRGAEVYVVTPDAGSDTILRDAVVYLTCVHETGHALGLEHTRAFADIMYSFQFGGDIAEYFGRYRRKLAARGDIRKTSALSEDDRRQLTDRFR